MSCRKKKKATLEVVKDEKDEDGAGGSEPEQNDDEAAQKKKADDLWALFLSDVGPRPKDSAASQPCGTDQVGGACSQYNSGWAGPVGSPAELLQPPAAWTTCGVM